MAEIKEAPKSKTVPINEQGASTEMRRPSPAPPTGNGNPLGVMHRFAQEMDRLFDDFGLRMPSMIGRGRELLLREAGLIPAEWTPRIEVKEQDGKILLRADLPGMSKDDIQVDVTQDLLTIKGERKQEKKEEREGYSYNECSYGSFYRSIPLPEGMETSKATAEFHNGVLEVAIPAPKRSEVKAQRLTIQEKK